MPKYIVLQPHEADAGLVLEGNNPKDAIENADPLVALPGRIALLEFVGEFVVLPPDAADAEVVQRPPQPTE